MRRLVIILFSLFFVQSAISSQGQDLNQTMKNMGHAYKQAMEATEAQEINRHLNTMLSLLKQSKLHNFKTDVKAESLQGLEKVVGVINEAQSLLAQQQIQQAKQLLKEVDALRKDYHKLHEPPGFWELLFGK
ncbi:MULTISPECIES: cytochrome b562 [unclassified Pseudoalteromonas]|uniref:cytochrome b562 n=1 Tax=unclassified Pseudoalteromonas TaxID=194690 RepID=UPI002097D04B|nr:cytochrome b562 [Pseudoalteromonas sp. XMcav2-N]MCO7190534.1 cytochrome b562 [Pseudoalteromonas sp. XMcav2-N]